MHRQLVTTWALLLGVGVFSSSSIAAGERTAAERHFFETRIRPVFVQHCYGCHAIDADELAAGLRLDDPEAMLAGGQSGRAIVPGNPDASLLIQALRYDGLEMPPEKPLPAAVIHDFEEWIRRGAADPREVQTVATDQAHEDPQQPLWSLAPLHHSEPPAVSDADWSRDPLDQFVLARLEAEQTPPADDASARELIRRLSFDLHGLPPTADEIDSFTTAYAANADAAVAELVDRLLAQPQYGERWGRHWLDVARYAESNGNDGLSRNPTFPHAWRYRDYVIAALNDDLPYDRFLVEQIAGDLLPSGSPQDRDRRLVATGFLALAAKPAKAMNQDFDMDVVADQIDLIGRGILGLSIGCARCHDHKFDPIPTRDYYALAGIFQSTETLWGAAGHETLTAPPTDLHVLTTADRMLPPEDFVETVVLRDSATGVPKKIPPPKWPAGTPVAMGGRDRKEPADSKINIQGESKKLGEQVQRGFLAVLQPPATPEFAISHRESGRLQLARWLTSTARPVTARVLINRVWLHLFGRGLVGTPNDFGVYGERPTHPALLDHLATRFIDEGWSLKQLIRIVTTSRTYRLTSRDTADRVAADPDNRLLSRHLRRRLDAESLRDAMLTASGQLDRSPGKGSIIQHRDILVNLAGSLHEPSNRRSVYLCYLRGSPPPSLAAFDLPDFSEPIGQRDVATVPGQALHLFNNPFVIAQAEHLAQRVYSMAATVEIRIGLAFRFALGRSPDSHEREQATAVLAGLQASQDQNETDPLQAWVGLCQGLLMSNEFRYVD
jgi:cytochrome c553